MPEKTHWKKMTNPNYLGAYSIEDGRDLILTIAYVRQEDVIGSDGKKEECAVCHWKERNYKPMILNVTNMKTIAKVVGSPYIEDWPGHRIQIGTEQVRAFGTITDALRVRPEAPREEKQPEIPCEECGELITPAYKMNVEQLAAYTSERYGRRLCANCAKKAVEVQPDAADA